MRGKGISVGHPQSRTCFGRKTLQRCKNNGEADNVVLIDVDSDNLNNVIIIDVPESLKQKLRGSNVLRKDKKCQFRTVICIDDDENSDSSHSGVGADSGHDFYNDASSSGRFHPALNHTRNSVDAVGEEYQFGQENLSPLKLSKCKRTYSGKVSSRNRYGLGPESDTDSSDNDYADCEFMEDSFGKLREQWEKANMMKKYDVRNGQSGKCDQAATGLRTDTQPNVENPTDKPTEAQPCPYSSNARYEEENPSVETGCGNLGSTSNDPKKIPLADFCLKSTQETQFSNTKAHNCGRGESFPVEPALNNAEGKTKKHVKHGTPCFLDEDNHCSQGPSVCSSHEQGNEQVDYTKKSSREKEKTPPAEPCMSNPEPTVGINFGHNKANLANEDVSFISTQPAVETEVDCGGEKFKKAPSCNTPFPAKSEVTGSCHDRRKLSGERLFENIKPPNKLKLNHCGADGELKAVTKDTFSEGLPVGKSYVRKQKGCYQDIVKPILEEPSLCSVPCNEVNTQPNLLARELSGEFMSNHQEKEEEEEKDGPLDIQDGDVMSAVRGSIINKREKLKETDEYKRAMEEEWASRQQELQLQAEEAQKLRQLRKRKKAESMRLLDMERRQKQRVEEMRESQKKDEENMNLKEQIRAEVRKELNQLEIMCRDMASLLRGLGIQVGGGTRPSLQEVRTAYKRALLSFHPDRACGSDIRQLVESEEKFKLISRMKEKLLTTS